MGFEDPDFIEDFNRLEPFGNDPRSEGDDHMRGIKKAIQDSFPNTNGAWRTTSSIRCGQGTLSDNVMVRADANTIRRSWGQVNADGTFETGSGDYSASRSSEGHYSIVFDDQASAVGNQVLICQQAALNPNFSEIYGIAVNPFSNTTYLVYTSWVNTWKDTDFQFIREWW